jgi:hypothetical protein
MAVMAGMAVTADGIAVGMAIGMEKSAWKSVCGGTLSGDKRHGGSIG